MTEIQTGAKQTDAQGASIDSAPIYLCPFCKKKVEKEYESLQGCRDCAEDWMINEQVDHPVG